MSNPEQVSIYRDASKDHNTFQPASTGDIQYTTDQTTLKNPFDIENPALYNAGPFIFAGFNVF